ncbi:MAG: AraC family transcriptional regulator [Peptoniphilus sp.]|uniref:helix-turn-helix domain-containing protein n=2 Tax=Peptoniphilus sp. TaxID=1971214 RepID=UPI0025E6232C|nr:helix-turn-helix domain-containing protein [Peptoniphilus sp.]MCI5643264.1 AraC family transcriptional regulator [Peptoniphilus sp.]
MIEIITGEALIHSVRDKISHWHDNIEAIDVIRGRAYCLVAGEKYSLEEGDICIVNSRAIHNLMTDDKDLYIKRYEISREFFTRNEKIYRKYIEKLINDERFSHIILKKEDYKTEAIRNIFESIYDFVTKKPVGYELGIVGMVHFFMQKVFIYYESSKNKKTVSQDNFLFRKMCDFIYTNYMNKLTLENIASMGNVSKSKAINIFNKYAQRSPVDFLNLYRLKVASEKLKDTEQSISEIALNTGFNQPSYFNRLFFREYNMTPSEYRKS